MKNPYPENWEPVQSEEVVEIRPTNGTGAPESIKVTVPAFRDRKSGEIFLGADAIRKLDDVRARYTGLLTTDEIKELRGRLGTTQTQLCALLQIGEKTWSRWESGRERPSRSMNLLLKALRDGRIDVPWLRHQQDPKSSVTHSPTRHLFYTGNNKLTIFTHAISPAWHESIKAWPSILQYAAMHGQNLEEPKECNYANYNLTVDDRVCELSQYSGRSRHPFNI